MNAANCIAACPGWPQLAEAFCAAGRLDAGDVAVVDTLAAAGGRQWQAGDAQALLGLALAVRAPRMGHVGADLAAPPAGGDDDGVQWPADGGAWMQQVAALGPPLVGADEASRCPFAVSHGLVYMHRMLAYECRLASALRLRAAQTGLPPWPQKAERPLDMPQLAADLQLLCGPDADEQGAPNWQKVAAALAVRGGLLLLTGGPGTGKTTTLARALAALLRQAPDPAAVSVALCAPTGKAAVRMTEALQGQIDTIAALPGFADAAARLRELSGSTIDRLLGYNPQNPTRFRSDAGQPLPHDVVVVDEVSMVDLPKMCKLVEAVRPAARLLLVGDPDQLASVEAGCVLGDLRRAVQASGQYGGAAAAFLAAAMPQLGVPAPSRFGPLDACAVHLRRNFRSQTDDKKRMAIAEVAADMATGNTAAALQRLGDPAPAGTLPFRHFSGQGPVADRAAVAAAVEFACQRYRPLHDRASATFTDDDVQGIAEALGKLGSFRVLCALRGGLRGAEAFNAAIADKLAGGKAVGSRAIGSRAVGSKMGPLHAGQPVMVTENDHAMQLFNGDVGLCVQLQGAGLRVAFAGADGQLRLLAPQQLPPNEPCYAMTIHKSQGSEFAEVLVVLPAGRLDQPPSPILTRELLYTALTRAKSAVALLADEPALRSAMDRQIARYSRLTARIVGGEP